MVDLESWFALRAQEDGLENIKTAKGTVYWATHSSASVAEPGVFKEFVINNKLWELLETRAAKLAVKDYTDAHGVTPPGVNFASVKVFNLRANKD